MIIIQLDTLGHLSVKWPRTDEGTLKLARQYVACQSTLSVEEQLKDIPLADMQTWVTQAEETVESAYNGEVGRAIAAETLRQLLVQARKWVTLLILQLKGRHSNNLAELENWGLATTQGVRGVKVHKPTNPYPIIAFLRAYAVQEATLPVEAQIANPSLADVQALVHDLETALTSRRTGRNQREIGVSQRDNILSELRRALRVAVMLLVYKNGGRVTTALQQHGFNVVERARPSSKKREDSEAITV